MAGGTYGRRAVVSFGATLIAAAIVVATVAGPVAEAAEPPAPDGTATTTTATAPPSVPSTTPGSTPTPTPTTAPVEPTTTTSSTPSPTDRPSTSGPGDEEDPSAPAAVGPPASTPVPDASALATAAVGPVPVPSDMWDARPYVGMDQTYLYIEGDARTGIIDDGRYLLTNANSMIWVEDWPNRLRVFAQGDQAFDVTISPPGGYGLITETGLYDQIPDSIRGDGARGAMSWVVSGAGGRLGNSCTSIGRLAIDEITRVGDRVESLSLRFEQTCVGFTTGTIRGKFHWVASDTTGPSRPVVPAPTTLWDLPTPTGISEGQDHLLLESGPNGPYPGHDDGVVVPGEAGFVIGEAGSMVAISEPVEGGLSLALAGPEEFGALSPGYYPALTRSPRTNRAAGGIDFSGYGRSCTLVTGWFVVDRIDRVEGRIVGLDVRFEYDCLNSDAVRGELHIGTPGTNRTPGGTLDGVVGAAGSVIARGWAFDPDEPTAPVGVQLEVDGVVTTDAAGALRRDVGAAFPGVGDQHGFELGTPSGPGLRRLCAYALDRSRAVRTLIGCRELRVPFGSPFGNAEVATSAPDSVRVAGWALDPESISPIEIHVYVDGRIRSTHANTQRPDIAAAFPGSGASHGFDVTVGAEPGRRQVCVYGINRGYGSNSSIGCRTVVVPGGSPGGSLDVLTGAAGTVRAQGWAIDPDTAAPVSVHVYVDGRYATAAAASTRRPDVGSAFPAYGADHGFDITVPTTPGRHTVCVYGIDVGVGDNALIGCRTGTAE